METILASFGVHNGVADVDGVLCKGTYEQMGRIVYNLLCESGCDVSADTVTQHIINTYNDSVDAGDIRPTSPHLADVLYALKQQNKKLAVVTTDNESITRKCLKALKIEHFLIKYTSMTV